MIDENNNFVMVGDARDIPMTIGLISMAWNACELSMHHLLRTLASKGDPFHARVVEPLIVELGSVGLAQALNCYAAEFPGSESRLAAAVKHASTALENARPYRNYYIHGISGVSRYGLDFSFDTIERNIPIHEAMTAGPFGKVYQKTAKGKSKFSLDFITKANLLDFNNHLARFYDHLQELTTAVVHYFHQLPQEERAQPPLPLPLLSTLKKPEFDHPKLQPRPALAPYDPIPDDEEED